MSNHIKHALLLLACFILASGCATDRLLKKESASIQKEKENVSPIVPAKPEGPKELPKIESVSPLKGKTITLTANKASFTEVFSAIADRAGLDLVMDSRLVPGSGAEQPLQVSGEAGKVKQSNDRIVLPPVTISFNRTPLAEALDNLASSLHIFYQVNGRTISVKGTESKTFHLNFLSSQKQTSLSVGGDVLGNSYTGPSTSSGSATAGTSSGSTSLSGEFSIRDSIPAATNDICAQIEETVKSSLSRHGTYSLNRALGFLEVNDMRDSIERIDSYIRTIKKFYNSQVLITAKVVEVRLNDKSQYGIDWTSVNTSIGDFKFRPINQNLALPTSSLTPALEIEVHSDKHGFDAAMNALEEFGDVKVLSNPKVRATNGQPALISVGTNNTYIQEIKLTTTSDGNTTIITPDVTIGSIFDGIMLGVVPNIDLENGSINMNITPIKSRIVSMDERTISGNVYTLPKVALEEASSQIRVKSGNIIAMGGLINKSLGDESKSIPILGDIPFLGYLFSQKIKTVQTEELVILLEPIILAQE